ncbi:MAG: HAD family phosphatase [Opitutales bacterium]|jgi:HAD superfamily hydrolase (TIGR01509 family)|nr:HAD family phosphatase [Opitutales bacterium]
MKLGALFDWDGVVIDSSKAHEESWDLLGYEVGKPLPEGHFKKGFGRKNQVIIPEILEWTHDPEETERLGNRKEELYRDIVAEKGVDRIPGIEAFLQSLKEAGIGCAVGSSTPRKNVETVLEMVGFGPYFQAIVCAEDVTQGKPNPEVFLTGASKLALEAGNCAVFEDAYAGLQAAKAGGMKAIALATTHPAEELKDESPDLILENFLGFDAEKFSHLF